MAARRGATSLWRLAAVLVLGSGLAIAVAGVAIGRATLRPRVGRAMGLLPAAGSAAPALTGGIPVVYHGGPVMRDVTIHAVFWAPPGYHFDGSPRSGVPGYIALQQQFLADAAHDSGSPANAFSVLREYGDGAAGGQGLIHFDPATDTVIDSRPYPAPDGACPSPAGTATCVSDAALQAELDRVSGAGQGQRGLHNLWLIFLPPDVDTCVELGTCATSAYAGYHSLFDLGHGLTIYAAIPDPLVELTPPPGSDPEGNPEAEQAINTVAHEVVEAVSDPDGTGWMDPNGFETGDKCEVGPQQGPPEGYASDGAPYNQTIDGHPYLIQEMWSDQRGGCVASSPPGRPAPGAPDPARITLSQFSSAVSGRAGAGGGLRVEVALIRAGRTVAIAGGRTRRDGGWGPLRLRDRAGRPHAVGDDRDLLAVVYGPDRGTGPSPDLISTADGGNPFTQTGYTGWFDLDHGTAVATAGRGPSAVLVGPCAQTGVLDLRVGPLTPESPTDLCSNNGDIAIVRTAHIGPATRVTLSSLDNRAESFANPAGALVDLRVTLGEPGSVAAVGDPGSPAGGGFPVCAADLRTRSIGCSGLVPGSRYRLWRGGRAIAAAMAGGGGRLLARRLPIAQGQVVSLVNPAGRRLTALHIARLRVAITGNETILAGGTCQPGDYWGPPLRRAPQSSAVGSGIGGTGRICPSSGRARGLPDAVIAQTDEFSGGETVTEVPTIRSTAPLQDETLYGRFIASAQSGLPGPHGSETAGGVPIALTITPAGSHQPVFRAPNVDTVAGVAVGALAAGTYTATWILHDAAGDTRTLVTRFTEG